LTDLSGLESLASIGGDLTMYNNYVLADISALSGLSALDGDLYLHVNPELCQSLVDAFIEDLGKGLGGSLESVGSNDESC
jgi:hypothetical protein